MSGYDWDGSLSTWDQSYSIATILTQSSPQSLHKISKLESFIKGLGHNISPLFNSDMMTEDKNPILRCTEIGMSFHYVDPIRQDTITSEIKNDSIIIRFLTVLL